MSQFIYKIKCKQDALAIWGAYYLDRGENINFSIPSMNYAYCPVDPEDARKRVGLIAYSTQFEKKDCVEIPTLEAFIAVAKMLSS